MSGPKTDQAEICRQRRLALEDERRRRIARIKASTDKLQDAIRTTKSARLDIECKVASLKQELGQDAIWAGKLSELGEACDSFSWQLQSLINVDIPTDPDKIDDLTHLILDETKKAVASFELLHGQSVATAQRRMEQRQENKRQDAEHKILAAQFGGYSEAYSQLPNTIFAQLKHHFEGNKKTDPVLTESINTVLKEIEQLIINEPMQYTNQNALMQLAGNIVDAAEQGQQQIEIAIEDYHRKVPEILHEARIFEHTYQEYFAEYVDYLEVLNRNRQDPIAVVPKEWHRFATYKDLDLEIKRLHTLSKKENEHHFIRSQIDEVMKLFGYDMSKEIVFSASDLGKHYLCQNQTSQSAIHVHVSDQHQIMLEVVGLGTLSTESNSEGNADIVTSDRLTIKENSAMLKEQSAFCDIHPCIVKELSDRGVILREKSRREPNIKYCKKILSNQVDIIIDRDKIINAQTRRIDRSAKPKQIEQKL